MNKKKSKGVLLALLIIPIFIQIFLSTLPLTERFVFTGYSLLFLFLGFVGIYIVLGSQVILKIMPKKVLGIICNFFLIMGIISFVMYLFGALRFINTSEDAINVAFSYVIVGSIIGSYRIKSKYTLN